MRGLSESLVDRVYHRLKQDLFDFLLLPGDRFTETEVSLQMDASRTPVREALMRLEREGYLQMKSRAGWMVRPFEFRQFQELYDLRTILETASIRTMAKRSLLPEISALAKVWMVPFEQRLSDGRQISEADEQFHHTLVAAADNLEVVRLHREVTERIRIVRRLGYATGDRLAATYDDHQAILTELLNGQTDRACLLLEAHIAANRATVETITLGRLEAARSLRTPR